jgi:hypothetical protein
MGRLVKIGFFCHTMTYVRAREHTSAVSRQAVRPAQHRTSAMWVLGENLIFSLLSAYSPTPRATMNILKPFSLVCNLHAI